MQATRPALLQNLQLLRILVAVQVVYGHALHEAVELFHMPQPMDPFSQMNRIDIFFVISGFATFYASRGQFGGAGEGARFLRRRLTRLIPLYWLFTGLMVLALFLFSGEVAHASFSVEHLLASLFFVPWPNQDGETLPILILGWTLNYEILFSVLFAMALTLPLRAGMILIAGIIALAALAYPFVPEQVWVLKYWSNPVMLEFVFGMGLAGLFMRGARLSRSQGVLLALGGFALLLAVTAWPDRSLPLRFIWAGIPAAMICAGFAFAPQPTTSHWLYDRAAKTAAAGYVLYLAHPFVINIVALAWRKAALGSMAGSMLLFIPVTLMASVALAVVAHRWLEKPLNRYLDKPRRPRSEPTASGALVAAE